MKRLGGLFARVIEMENLKLAFLRASRGKAMRDDQRVYRAHLNDELRWLREGLIDGTYPVGNYRHFTISRPKPREIYAAAFRERVLHHALMNVCEPFIDRWLIDQTFACRRGYGQVRAVRRARANARRRKWYLKCDFKKFFDSIPHDGLKRMLARRFKDRELIFWFERIIDTYQTEDGHGLPIGNLTSQHLANLYLDQLDRYVAEGHSTVANGGDVEYVRYMDDFVYWADDKDLLRNLRDEIIAWSQERLELQVKEHPQINRTDRGMAFLGLRVFPSDLRVARGGFVRFQQKSEKYEWMFEHGLISEARLQSRVTSLTGFLLQGNTKALRRNAIQNEMFGSPRGERGGERALRGGNYNSSALDCRSGNRNGNNPSNNNNNGFRLCCSAAPQEQPAVPADFQFSPQRDEYEGNPALVGLCAEDDGLSLSFSKGRGGVNS